MLSSIISSLLPPTHPRPTVQPGVLVVKCEIIVYITVKHSGKLCWLLFIFVTRSRPGTSALALQCVVAVCSVQCSVAHSQQAIVWIHPMVFAVTRDSSSHLMEGGTSLLDILLTPHRTLRNHSSTSYRRKFGGSMTNIIRKNNIYSNR